MADVRVRILRGSALLLLVAAAAAWLLQGSNDRARASQDGKGQRPATPRVNVPRGWQQVSAGADHATWAGPGRMHTVTLGIVRASDTPLRSVVAQSRRQLARELPNYQPGPVHVLPDGSVRSLQQVGSAGGRIAVVQVWRRAGGVDAIATWTSADGSWPVPPARQAPMLA